ncbi:MAG: ACP S-malonyltransferase, partial [Candidatus Entotheonellia bacterium]
MISILVDHDIEGQVLILWGALAAGGWLELCSLHLVTFAQAGLPVDSNDRTVWRFAQTHGMVLLTH